MVVYDTTHASFRCNHICCCRRLWFAWLSANLLSCRFSGLNLTKSQTMQITSIFWGEVVSCAKNVHYSMLAVLLTKACCFCTRIHSYTCHPKRLDKLIFPKLCQKINPESQVSSVADVELSQGYHRAYCGYGLWTPFTHAGACCICPTFIARQEAAQSWGLHALRTLHLLYDCKIQILQHWFQALDLEDSKRRIL